jgi:hypothetical protein
MEQRARHPGHPKTGSAIGRSPAPPSTRRWRRTDSETSGGSERTPPPKNTCSLRGKTVAMVRSLIAVLGNFTLTFFVIGLGVRMQAHRSLRSPATKQRARPQRSHRQVAWGQVSGIVEHTNDHRCEDRRDDKQHHYADHERPPIFALPSCRVKSVARTGQGGYCAADTAEAPLRSWLMRSPTSAAWLVGKLRPLRSMPSCGGRRSGRRTISGNRRA